MKIFNKLVRDKIPEIISHSGKIPNFEVIKNDKDYLDCLEKKLLEECNEVINANLDDKIEELSDVLEVIHSISKFLGISLDELEKIRINKKEKRGGFKSRFFLKSVDE